MNKLLVPLVIVGLVLIVALIIIGVIVSNDTEEVAKEEEEKEGSEISLPPESEGLNIIYVGGYKYGKGQRKEIEGWFKEATITF